MASMDGACAASPPEPPRACFAQLVFALRCSVRTAVSASTVRDTNRSTHTKRTHRLLVPLSRTDTPPDVREHFPAWRRAESESNDRRSIEAGGWRLEAGG